MNFEVSGGRSRCFCLREGLELLEPQCLCGFDGTRPTHRVGAPALPLQDWIDAASSGAGAPAVCGGLGLMLVWSLRVIALIFSAE